MHLPDPRHIVPGRRTLAGLIAAGVIAMAVPPLAGAASPAPAPAPTPGGSSGSRACVSQVAAARSQPTVANLRAVGDCEIARRFTTLDTLGAAVSKATVLTAADRTALQTELSSTRSGLTALQATIDSETARPALLADLRRIATEYRVYLLVAPQAHLVIAADRVGAAGTVFGRVSTALASRIATAKAAGKDVTAAQGYLDSMNDAVARAVALASPLPARLLPLTPAEYNAGTAGPVLRDARADLLQARDLLLSARSDAKLCRDALRALGSTGAPASPAPQD